MGSSQQAPQQQLIVDPSKQSQPYMSGAAEVVPQLLSPAELKLQSSQLTAEQLQGMVSHHLIQISWYHAVEHMKQETNAPVLLPDWTLCCMRRRG